MARWESALEEQAKQLRFWRSPRGKRYAYGFAESVARTRPNERNGLALTADIEGMKLERAEPVWMSDEVVTMVEYAAETIRPEPIQESDLFTLEGFAVLPRPLYLKDIHERRVSFRAFSWGMVVFDNKTTGAEESGIHIVFYTHWRDRDDYSDADRYAVSIAGEAGMEYTMSHTTLIPWGRLPEGFFDDDNNGWMFRILLSFFKLANQRIFTRTRTYGETRAERRRIARLRPGNDGVLVVELRRPRAPQNEESESDVHWSRQWIVGAHWRNQWYPSLNEHRQVWIAPYVKGPEDKPLVLHARRVFEFTR